MLWAFTLLLSRVRSVAPPPNGPPQFPVPVSCFTQLYDSTDSCSGDFGERNATYLFAFGATQDDPRERCIQVDARKMNDNATDFLPAGVTSYWVRLHAFSASDNNVFFSFFNDFDTCNTTILNTTTNSDIIIRPGNTCAAGKGALSSTWGHSSRCYGAAFDQLPPFDTANFHVTVSFNQSSVPGAYLDNDQLGGAFASRIQSTLGPIINCTTCVPFDSARNMLLPSNISVVSNGDRVEVTLNAYIGMRWNFFDLWGQATRTVDAIQRAAGSFATASWGVLSGGGAPDFDISAASPQYVTVSLSGSVANLNRNVTDSIPEQSCKLQAYGTVDDCQSRANAIFAFAFAPADFIPSSTQFCQSVSLQKSYYNLSNFQTAFTRADPDNNGVAYYAAIMRRDGNNMPVGILYNPALGPQISLEACQQRTYQNYFNQMANQRDFDICYSVPSMTTNTGVDNSYAFVVSCGGSSGGNMTNNNGGNMNNNNGGNMNNINGTWNGNGGNYTNGGNGGNYGPPQYFRPPPGPPPQYLQTCVSELYPNKDACRAARPTGDAAPYMFKFSPPRNGTACLRVVPTGNTGASAGAPFLPENVTAFFVKPRTSLPAYVDGKLILGYYGSRYTLYKVFPTEDACKNDTDLFNPWQSYNNQMYNNNNNNNQMYNGNSTNGNFSSGNSTGDSCNNCGGSDNKSGDNSGGGGGGGGGGGDSIDIAFGNFDDYLYPEDCMEFGPQNYSIYTMCYPLAPSDVPPELETGTIELTLSFLTASMPSDVLTNDTLKAALAQEMGDVVGRLFTSDDLQSNPCALAGGGCIYLNETIPQSLAGPHIRTSNVNGDRTEVTLSASYALRFRFADLRKYGYLAYSSLKNVSSQFANQTVAQWGPIVPEGFDPSTASPMFVTATLNGTVLEVDPPAPLPPVEAKCAYASFKSQDDCESRSLDRAAAYYRVPTVEYNLTTKANLYKSMYNRTEASSLDASPLEFYVLPNDQLNNYFVAVRGRFNETGNLTHLSIAAERTYREAIEGAENLFTEAVYGTMLPVNECHSVNNTRSPNDMDPMFASFYEAIICEPGITGPPSVYPMNNEMGDKPPRNDTNGSNGTVTGPPPFVPPPPVYVPPPPQYAETCYGRVYQTMDGCNYDNVIDQRPSYRFRFNPQRNATTCIEVLATRNTGQEAGSAFLPLTQLSFVIKARTNDVEMMDGMSYEGFFGNDRIRYRVYPNKTACEQDNTPLPQGPMNNGPGPNMNQTGPGMGDFNKTGMGNFNQTGNWTNGNNTNSGNNNNNNMMMGMFDFWDQQRCYPFHQNYSVVVDCYPVPGGDRPPIENATVSLVLSFLNASVPAVVLSNDTYKHAFAQDIGDVISRLVFSEETACARSDGSCVTLNQTIPQSLQEPAIRGVTYQGDRVLVTLSATYGVRYNFRDLRSYAFITVASLREIADALSNQTAAAWADIALPNSAVFNPADASPMFVDAFLNGTVLEVDPPAPLPPVEAKCAFAAFADLSSCQTLSLANAVSFYRIPTMDFNLTSKGNCFKSTQNRTGDSPLDATGIEAEVFPPEILNTYYLSSRGFFNSSGNLTAIAVEAARTIRECQEQGDALYVDFAQDNAFPINTCHSVADDDNSDPRFSGFYEAVICTEPVQPPPPNTGSDSSSSGSGNQGPGTGVGQGDSGNRNNDGSTNGGGNPSPPPANKNSTATPPKVQVKVQVKTALDLSFPQGSLNSVLNNTDGRKALFDSVINRFASAAGVNSSSCNITSCTYNGVDCNTVTGRRRLLLARLLLADDALSVTVATTFTATVASTDAPSTTGGANAPLPAALQSQLTAFSSTVTSPTTLTTAFSAPLTVSSPSGSSVSLAPTSVAATDQGYVATVTQLPSPPPPPPPPPPPKSSAAGLGMSFLSIALSVVFLLMGTMM